MKNNKVAVKKLPSANKWLAESLKDPEFKKEYDKLQPEYEIIQKILDARIKKKLTQKELAERMGTKQSALARLESGRANPTISFIQKLASALGTDITLTFSGK